MGSSLGGVYTMAKTSPMNNFENESKLTWLPTWQHVFYFVCLESSPKVKFLGQPRCVWRICVKGVLVEGF